MYTSASAGLLYANASAQRLQVDEIFSVLIRAAMQLEPRSSRLRFHLSCGEAQMKILRRSRFILQRLQGVTRVLAVDLRVSCALCT